MGMSGIGRQNNPEAHPSQAMKATSDLDHDLPSSPRLEFQLAYRIWNEGAL